MWYEKNVLKNGLGGRLVVRWVGTEAISCKMVGKIGMALGGLGGLGSARRLGGFILFF